MLNKVSLQGRMVSDPELRQTASGVSVTAFRVAVNRDYNREETDWIDIVAWRQTAEFVCKYFQKGNMILLTGAIQTRNYEDKNGNNRTAVEVTADQIYFCESKNTQKTDRPGGSSFPIGDMSDYEELDSSDGDLPF